MPTLATLMWQRHPRPNSSCRGRTEYNAPLPAHCDWVVNETKPYCDDPVSLTASYPLKW